MSLSLVELFDSTKKLAAWRGTGYGQNQNWVLKNMVPYIGTKSLLFQAECMGETVAATHITNIMFSGVRYLEDDVENAEYKTLDFKGDTVRYAYPDLHTKCTTKCSCPDFKFRWEYADKKVKALFGNLSKKYIRKTKTRPPVNPEQIPGMCKHVWQLQSFLRVEGYIK